MSQPSANNTAIRTKRMLVSSLQVSAEIKGVSYVPYNYSKTLGSTVCYKVEIRSICMKKMQSKLYKINNINKKWIIVTRTVTRGTVHKKIPAEVQKILSTRNKDCWNSLIILQIFTVRNFQFFTSYVKESRAENKQVTAEGFLYCLLWRK